MTTISRTWSYRRRTAPSDAMGGCTGNISNRNTWHGTAPLSWPRNCGHTLPTWPSRRRKAWLNHGADGSRIGSDRGTESPEPAWMSRADEQYPQPGGGNHNSELIYIWLDVEIGGMADGEKWWCKSLVVIIFSNVAFGMVDFHLLLCYIQTVN